MSETEVEFDVWADPFNKPAASQEEQPAEDVTPEAETTETRARNEKGQFVKQDETTETPEQTAERLWAGKYKTPEAAEEAWIEAQQLVGSVRHEQGQLRSQVEQLVQALQAQQAQQQPRSVQDFEAMLETDPQEAALYALTVGDNRAYDRAKQAWNELAPGAPAIWEQNLRLQQQLTELETRFGGLEGPVAEQANQRILADAYREIQVTTPDFADIQPFMAEIVGDMAASGYDWVTPALESGDKKKAVAALTSLSALARARASGNLSDQARTAAQEHVAATEQAKREAIVASASTSMPDPPEKTTAQKVAASWAQFDISALRDA